MISYAMCVLPLWRGSADATQDPQEASRRLQATLEAMAQEGYITAEEAEQAGSVQWLTEDVAADGTPQVATIRARTEKQADFNDVRFQDIGSEYWLELVRTQLRERLGTGIEAKGLRVYTTFDPRLQRAAQDAVLEELDGEDAPLGSLVAIDNIGRIRAMVGPREVRQSD